MDSTQTQDARFGAIEGTWHGTVEVGGRPVALVLRIGADAEGLRVSADFPQLGRNGIAFSDASFEHGTLRFASRSLGAYTGDLRDDGARIEGAFSGNASHALTLHRGELELGEPSRPQTPQAPFDYAIEAVQVDRAALAFRLAGTLTLPPVHALRAGIVLVNGSGALDRDETVFGHKPYWVLADHLSRHGYAVLRLDDRGVGESGGERTTITIDDEADDMQAAFDWLLARLPGTPVGLIGHSMGSSVARVVAARRADVTFVVSMAGAGAPMGEVLAAREGDALRRLGADAGVIARHAPFARALFDELRDRPVGTAIDAARIFAIAERFDAVEGARKLGIEAWIARYNEPWFRSALRLDPMQALARIAVPFLAINGERDLQVPSRANLDAMARTLRAAAHRDFTVLELAALNHLFQTCTTGEAYEYPVIEETFAPLALDAIRGWLDTRFGPVAA